MRRVLRISSQLQKGRQACDLYATARRGRPASGRQRSAPLREGSSADGERASRRRAARDRAGIATVRGGISTHLRQGLVSTAPSLDLSAGDRMALVAVETALVEARAAADTRPALAIVASAVADLGVRARPMRVSAPDLLDARDGWLARVRSVGRAASTERAYRGAIDDFQKWLAHADRIEAKFEERTISCSTTTGRPDWSVAARDSAHARNHCRRCSPTSCDGCAPSWSPSGAQSAADCGVGGFRCASSAAAPDGRASRARHSPHCSAHRGDLAGVDARLVAAS